MKMTRKEALQLGATIVSECVFGSEFCTNPEHMRDYAKFDDGTEYPIDEEEVK